MRVNTDLIRRAQEGDREAFSCIIDGCYERIFGYALKSCGNPADAEDIAQQSCIKLARKINQFRFESAFSTWLYQLVIHCARDWHQSEKRHQRKAMVSTDETIYQANDEQSIYLEQVLAFIAQMGEGYRDTVILVMGEGLSHAEAAKVQKVKESTISWRLHQVRQRLKRFASLEHVQ